jgi:hypothetical protein
MLLPPSPLILKPKDPFKNTLKYRMLYIAINLA